MSKKEQSEDEYLRQHLQDVDSTNTVSNEPQYVQAVEATRSAELKYFHYDVRELPCGKFYPTGTMFMVRPAVVKEIQAYSMVDDNNIYDVVEKMNDMLLSCVRVKYPDGKMGTYLDIKDQDRIYLIFVIRELTFQQGNGLFADTRCSCGNDCKVELKRVNFRKHQIDEKFTNYFDDSKKSFQFKVKNGKKYELTLPNIGIQKAFTDYIIKESNEKRPPNLSFLKVIPYLLNNASTISIEGIKAKLQEYENIDDISFQFLNSAVEKMTFGIKELATNCSACGLEVHTEMVFPSGASGIFVIHDAFEAYLKK